MLFTKVRCYLLDPFTAPAKFFIIRIRGPDNMYKMMQSKEEDKKLPSAVPTSAAIVKNLSLHNTMNHSSKEKLAWFKGIPKCHPPHPQCRSGRWGLFLCCVYTRQSQVFSEKGPISQDDKDVNFYLQLLADAGD